MTIACAVAALALAASLPSRAQTNSTVRGNPIDFSAFSIITDRNIFDPNRRPPRRNEEAPPPPPIVDSFSLAGTMSYDNGNFAVFDGSSSDYHKVLEQGAKIAGYTVAQITHDLVKLISGTNEVELKVGMQMRRSSEGNWSASAASTESSYAFDSSSREGSGSRRERGRFRGGNRFSGATGNGSPGADQGGAGAVEADAAGGSPDVSNLNPNDPVARLMLRRLQQTGGAPAASVTPVNTQGGARVTPAPNQNGQNQNGNNQGNQGGEEPPPGPPDGGPPPNEN